MAKKLFKWLLAFFLASSLVGYGKNATQEIRKINNIEYEININKLTQKTEDEDKVASFGVISDTHGFYENVNVFSETFKKQGLDGIIMLGDYAQHFRKKPHPDLRDYDEIVMCLEAAAKTGLPVYVVPGNHDMRKDYERAINQLFKKYIHIFDLSKIRIVDGDDFDFVSNPFGTDFTYLGESFRGTLEQIRQIKEYAKLLKNDDDPEVLVSHQQPRCNGKGGIDMTFDGKNVGEETLDKIMKECEIKLSASGHIHEAGGRACTSNGELINPNVLSEDLRFNPGAASPWEYPNGKTYNGIAGILTIEGNRAKYEIISLKS